MCGCTYLATLAAMPPPVAPRIPKQELAAWSAFIWAHSAVIRRIEEALEARGLPPLTWYDVLWPLSRSPERRLRMNQLSEEVVLSRTALSRLVDRIERAGLLRREPVPEDRRGAYAAITEEGEEALRKIWPVYGRMIRALFLKPLGKEDLKRVLLGMERVGEAARPPAKDEWRRPPENSGGPGGASVPATASEVRSPLLAEPEA
jgi:DNA-binding MarR family transcriptional regulator